MLQELRVKWSGYLEHPTWLHRTVTVSSVFSMTWNPWADSSGVAHGLWNTPSLVARGPAGGDSHPAAPAQHPPHRPIMWTVMWPGKYGWVTSIADLA